MIDDPIMLGTLKLKNRLVMPPMETGLADVGHVTEALTEHYRKRALLSAPGLIILEHCCISEQGRASRNQLSIADDSLVEEHTQVTEAVHSAGSRIFIQLSHGGSSAEPLDGGETVSASEIVNPRKPELAAPRPLTESEILSLESLFAEAARRAAEAGYDGIEIHSAHGYLLNQFYSPITNRRTDRYGCRCMEDRLRFLLETLTAVRKAVGPDMPLAVRLGGADYMSGGSTEEDAVEACRLLEKAGVNLFDISGGMCGFILQGRSEPGYFGSMTEKIRSAVSVPVLLTGGVTSPSEAEALLQAGKADLIGVGRPLFRDAHWRKNAC